MNKNSKKSPVAVLCSGLGTAILVAVILICLPLVLSSVFGGQCFVVVSGSMEPEIPKGSLVYVKSTNPEKIQSDDVIAFYGGRNANAIITHRVVENRIIMGEFITKGDANQTNDMNPVRYENLIGRVEWSVPQVGMAAQLLTGTQGKIAAGSLIGFAVILHSIAAILEKDKE